MYTQEGTLETLEEVVDDQSTVGVCYLDYRKDLGMQILKGEATGHAKRLLKAINKSGHKRK